MDVVHSSKGSTVEASLRERERERERESINEVHTQSKVSISDVEKTCIKEVPHHHQLSLNPSPK